MVDDLSAGPRRTRRRGPTLLLLLGLLVAGLVLSGQSSPTRWLVALGLDPVALGLVERPRPAAVSGDGRITLFFTTPDLVYPDQPKRRIAPAAERALLADLAAARHTIELASFEYNLMSLAQALAQAQTRGVQVRLALDRDNLVDPRKAKWAGSVEDAGVTISWQQGSSFQHSKFVIIDQRVVWTGSWNVTNNDTYRNNNNLLRIHDPAIVANYRAEFERMAAGRFGGMKSGPTPYSPTHIGRVTIETYFSPHEPVRPHIVRLLSQAQERIEVMAFAFTDDEIGAALVERHHAGVRVRVVFERRNARGVGSEFPLLQAEGVDILHDGNCYTMHHKVIIIDQRIVITGSYNFTARAESINDENTLIIYDPVLAAAYSEEFARVYAQAQRPPRCQ
ncbi:phospholipase D-like domain-containing protein [Candidatus Viridilinea mediisalina]|uniref:phospholipase D n=1 Tax=Candidatus Viridilinea mediisalina TaxID=2024553 RepID=A0A2A6RPZ2_9CHLR|nr:phospholipase D-like domain-containing protein [Candidatus Viridilinea mediisalina]PDW04971.1 phospholipase [Candidatus Viridilinea mediisalina]